MPQLNRSVVLKVSEAAQAASFLFGVDTSHWNGPINVYVLKTVYGVRFIIAKSSQFRVDDQFYRTYSLSREIELPVGPYHFFVPGYNSLGQAELFAEVVNDVTLKYGKPTMLPTIDLELRNGVTGNAFLASLNQFERRFYQLTDYTTTAYYTSAGYWNDTTGGAAFDNPLFIASWGTVKPTLPKGCTSYALHQYKVAKLGAVNYDHDLFNGDEKALVLYANGIYNPPIVIPVKLKVVVKSMFVRAGPGKEFKAVGGLVYGQTVTVYDTREISNAESWVRISPVYDAPKWAARVYAGQVLLV